MKTQAHGTDIACLQVYLFNLIDQGMPTAFAAPNFNIVKDCVKTNFRLFNDYWATTSAKQWDKKDTGLPQRTLILQVNINANNFKVMYTATRCINEA